VDRGSKTGGQDQVPARAWRLEGRATSRARIASPNLALRRPDSANSLRPPAGQPSVPTAAPPAQLSGPTPCSSHNEKKHGSHPSCRGCCLPLCPPPSHPAAQPPAARHQVRAAPPLRNSAAARSSRLPFLVAAAAQGLSRMISASNSYYAQHYSIAGARCTPQIPLEAATKRAPGSATTAPRQCSRLTLHQPRGSFRPPFHLSPWSVPSVRASSLSRVAGLAWPCEPCPRPAKPQAWAIATRGTVNGACRGPAGWSALGRSWLPSETACRRCQRDTSAFSQPGRCPYSSGATARRRAGEGEYV